MKKGQASIEILIILAISMVVLIAIFSYGNNSVNELNKTKLISQAQDSVDSLVKAANTVFYQGVGAKKKIYYFIPTNTDSSKSGIEGNSVVINILESDVYAKADVSLSGNLDISPGGHWVWVTAKEGYVYFGLEEITVNKNQIYVSLEKDSSVQENFIVSNNSESSAEVWVELDWSNPDVNISLSNYNFSLSSENSQTINVDIRSSISGIYSGVIKIGARYNGIDENIILPLTVEVSSSGSVSGGGELVVFPATRVQVLDKGLSDNNSFLVCNNTSSDFGAVSFSLSGIVGSWISPISSLNSLSSSSCQTVNYSLSVPLSASIGENTGTITASSGSYSDSLSLSVNIPTSSVSTYYAMFYPTSGTDTTNGNYSLVSGDLTNLSISDGSDYQSQGNWPKQNAGYSSYIEFVFSPNISTGAVINDVNIVHEFALSSGSGNAYAKMQIWDGTSWNDISLITNQTVTSSDVTYDLNLSSYIDSASKVNGLKVRFFLYFTANTNKKTNSDLVSIGVKYTN